MFSAVLPGVASVVQAYPYTQTLAMLRDATAMPGAGLFDQRVVVRAVLFNTGLVVGSGLDNQSLVVSAVLHDECFVSMAALGAKGLKRVADLFDIAPLAAPDWRTREGVTGGGGRHGRCERVGLARRELACGQVMQTEGPAAWRAGLVSAAGSSGTGDWRAIHCAFILHPWWYRGRSSCPKPRVGKSIEWLKPLRLF